MLALELILQYSYQSVGIFFYHISYVQVLFSVAINSRNIANEKCPVCVVSLIKRLRVSLLYLYVFICAICVLLSMDLLPILVELIYNGVVHFPRVFGFD